MFKSKEERNLFEYAIDAYQKANNIADSQPDIFQFRQNQLLQALALFVLYPNAKKYEEECQKCTSKNSKKKGKKNERSI